MIEFDKIEFQHSANGRLRQIYAVIYFLKRGSDVYQAVRDATKHFPQINDEYQTVQSKISTQLGITVDSFYAFYKNGTLLHELKKRQHLNDKQVAVFKQLLESDIKIEQERDSYTRTDIKAEIRQEFDKALNKISKTECQIIIDQRIGQQILRKYALSEYGHKCAMCNVDHPGLLRVSHIMPWSENIQARLDIQNILLLCGLHDLAFELGIITVEDDFTIKLNISGESRAILDSITSKTLSLPKSESSFPRQEYLKNHRDKFKSNP